MKNNRNRIVLTGIGLVVIVLAMVFGTAGVTAYAAQSALPGDTLYGVKTTLEQTRLSMSRDAAARAELYMEFAEIRLQEISSLISEQRFQDISTATTDFEKYSNKAIAELEVVAQGDPQRAALLTAKISEALSRYARTLTSMLDSVPDGVRAQMSQVIQTAQGQSSPAFQSTEVEFEGVVDTIIQGAWIIAGKTVFIHTQTEIKDSIAVGDYVKVHATLNGDGDLVAREIELTSRDASGNSNDNNTNSDDDANSNDDNSNDNDANSNDDNSNNANDDNSNDDDMNANANSNSNDDHEDGNSNSSINANSNDDDHEDGNSNSSVNNNDDDHQDDDSGNSNSNSNDDDHQDDDSGNSNSNDDDKGNEND
jgi:hypothetical protein